MISQMSGPSQGSAVRPALCQPVRHDVSPSRSARSFAGVGELGRIGVVRIEDRGRKAVRGEHDRRPRRLLGRQRGERVSDALRRALDERRVVVPALEKRGSKAEVAAACVARSMYSPTLIAE